MTSNDKQQSPRYDHQDAASSFADSMDRDLLEEEDHKPSLIVSRRLVIPDMVRVDRCFRLPEYGPKILFFSGGSALRTISQALKRYTHNSIHLITPFDSGGSSAELRKAFGMLSVGDLRNRLMALADERALKANPHVSAFVSHRLEGGYEEFQQILQGQHLLIRQIKLPLRSILMSHLRWLAHRMPATFDWQGASMGNLIITGCFLEHDRDIVTAIYWIGKLLGVNGVVRPVTGANLHIRAYYSGADAQVGQHLLGKGGARRKIEKIDLVESLGSPTDAEAASCHIDMVSSELVASADVIVFPVGSFFGSVLVNLLPEGVGRAIVQRHCPKVYIPNTGDDPEMYGYTLLECVQTIVDLVRRDAGQDVDMPQILTTVLVDTLHCEYCVEIDKAAIKRLGIVVLDVPLVADDQAISTESKSSKLDPTKVSQVLLTLGS